MRFPVPEGTPVKFNLGCGKDIKPGYFNIDSRELPGVDQVVNLGDIWPWHHDIADEVLMLDFLEHFPYNKTDTILSKAWRLLKPGGIIEVQVPDFEHCARAAIDQTPYNCNVCGFEFLRVGVSPERLASQADGCPTCKSSKTKIAQAAIWRLYGGQDYEGNWHYTAFTKKLLLSHLTEAGFGKFEDLEKEHQWLNWNIKVRAVKIDYDWESNG